VVQQNSLNVKIKQLILTARGKPRRTNTTKEAILIAPLAPITCSIPPE